VTLRLLADAITTRLQAFAGRHGRPIAARLGRPAALTTSLLRAEIAAHLRELGDLHAEVDKALDGAAGRSASRPSAAASGGWIRRRAKAAI
jgi:hypothetical protein